VRKRPRRRFTLFVLRPTLALVLWSLKSSLAKSKVSTSPYLQLGFKPFLLWHSFSSCLLMMLRFIVKGFLCLVLLCSIARRKLLLIFVLSQLLSVSSTIKWEHILLFEKSDLELCDSLALPGVLWVLPDSYLDVPNKDYGGV